MKFYLLLLILIIGLHIFFLLNLQFTAWPEMFSYAYLKNHGYLLYKDMIHPYPPLLTLGLGWVYKLFGYKIEVLKFATWGIIIVNDLVIFTLIKKLTKNSKFSVLGVFLYVLTQPFLEGNMLWFDLAIVPTILIGIYFFFSEKTNRNLFLSGFFFGLAAFTKQTTVIFILATLLILFVQKVKLKNFLIFLTGPSIIFATLVVRLIQEKALLGFFNSVLFNPFLHWSSFPGYLQFNLQRHDYLVLIILLIPLFRVIYNKSITHDKNIFYLSMFLILSGILVYPRFSFFHLQVFIAISVVLFAYQLGKIKRKMPVLGFFVLAVVIFIVYPAVKYNWTREVRFFSSKQLQLAEFVKSKSNKDERIYFLGLDSNLYVIANRLPPKPWTDNFGWYLEVPDVQENIVARWDTDPPVKIFWQEPGNGNWFDLGTYQPKVITNWIKSNYVKKDKLSDNIWVWERKK